MPKLRFHLLGAAHLETNRLNSACPFTQKIVRLADMLKANGHAVYFYGVEGSEVNCDGFYPVSTQEILRQTYGQRESTTRFYSWTSNDLAHRVFNENAIRAISQNKRERDILLTPMGLDQKPISDAVNLITVEPGIGYEGVSPTAFHVFESYAWMHYYYGKSGIENGGWYDAVIPNYYDPADFPYQPKKQNYLLYLGRITGRKGVQIASEAAKATGNELYVVGQGALDNPQEGLALGSETHIHYHAAVGPEERAELLGSAKAVLMPTCYIEPFGSVCMEAQFCGTPVITTDWGAFPETVLHGVTGYRCRCFEEFCWAIKNIGQIKPENCRRWAEENYGMAHAAKMYEEYFQRLYRLFDEGWYQQNEERAQLDWLSRSFCGT